jgi:hypothetical protein
MLWWCYIYVTFYAVVMLHMRDVLCCGGTYICRQEFVQVQHELAYNNALIVEREQGIIEIHEQIQEVNDIFQDLAIMVNDQGSMLGALYCIGSIILFCPCAGPCFCCTTLLMYRLL